MAVDSCPFAEIMMMIIIMMTTTMMMMIIRIMIIIMIIIVWLGSFLCTLIRYIGFMGILFMLSWMFQHDYLDTCCFECLTCM